MGNARKRGSAVRSTLHAVRHTVPPARVPGLENVEVRGSRVHGRGLFAARDFRKGERILQYLGEPLSKAEGQRRTDAQWEEGRVYTFDLSRRRDLDGAFEWNVARLANHSCDPNCESENDHGRAIWIVATRRIAKGDELSYDYNFPLIDPPPVCKCGAAKCRGYIVGSDHAQQLEEWKAANGRR